MEPREELTESQWPIICGYFVSMIGYFGVGRVTCYLMCVPIYVHLGLTIWAAAAFCPGLEALGKVAQGTEAKAGKAGLELIQYR